VAADSWGLSWGGTTGRWLASWASTFVPPTPQPEPEQTPAGRRTKRRYYVEIDGQSFAVQSPEEAQQVIAHARALAEQAATLAAQKVEAKRKPAPKVRPVRLKAPVVTASPELRIDLAPIRAEFARIYQDAATALELRLLLHKAQQDDEEEAILLLM
jgi:hypothetical protein